ncbi:hypothetical protein AGABI2DRAFT_117449 [Agaricus bisporus var. bisporus H97]|uniref:hypothetical protein n=1 Tax=Agaricus bisporus var. bisporus (strain H97 / ATCC MYA-4626 / FGSC 10389) TaxID=936046 RepID=UPI00029F7940|nr:hypothetical protein AGABI2DRAFT_117449 [Agaricus bisporus var. bisporus H97]EKV48646.1 hypothetical protein AGABI2DRAFT_117449 [Agaricus bisporus var. bisporus H97]
MSKASVGAGNGHLGRYLKGLGMITLVFLSRAHERPVKPSIDEPAQTIQGFPSGLSVGLVRGENFYHNPLAQCRSWERSLKSFFDSAVYTIPTGDENKYSLAARARITAIRLAVSAMFHPPVYHSPILVAPMMIPGTFRPLKGFQLFADGGFTFWAPSATDSENLLPSPANPSTLLSSLHLETTLMTLTESSPPDSGRSSLFTEITSGPIGDTSDGTQLRSVLGPGQALASLQTNASSSASSSPVVVRVYRRLSNSMTGLLSLHPINGHSLLDDDDSFLDHSSFSLPTDFDFGSPVQDPSLPTSDADHRQLERISNQGFDTAKLLSGLKEMGSLASEIVNSVNGSPPQLKTQVHDILASYMEDLKKIASDLIAFGVRIEEVVERQVSFRFACTSTYFHSAG